MKVLLFEYVTGGGLAAEDLPAALAREGGLMLAALLRDFAEIPEVELSVFRDARLPDPAEAPAGTRWIAVDTATDVAGRFGDALAEADAVWPIAPETGGVLERLCQHVESAGKRLLTSPAAAVRIAASKRATVCRLAERGVPAVPTAAVEPGAAPPDRWPVVVKPDDGAGCEGTQRIESPEHWRAWGESPAAAGSVVQPFREGEPLSLSALFAGGAARLLCCNRQAIRRDGDGFALAGCEVNAVADPDGRFARLAADIAAALPELWGYAGVDLLRTADGLEVLEINPRLTTSAAGLRPALGLNLAREVCRLDRSGRLPELAAGLGASVLIELEPGDGR